MNVPFSKISHYLFKPNPNVDIKYLEHDISGEKRVTEFLTRHAADTLDETAQARHREFIRDIDGKVQQQLRQGSLYRYAGITLLLLFIVLPSLILFFFGASAWTLIGGIYYTFFAYLLVEAYIQADRNYFEDQLYDQFKDEYLK